tara:strand:+ start:8013 stop:8363 length:351 start_codon:yes stop_codon:yes gene_type:complete
MLQHPTALLNEIHYEDVQADKKGASIEAEIDAMVADLRSDGFCNIGGSFGLIKYTVADILAEYDDVDGLFEELALLQRCNDLDSNIESMKQLKIMMDEIVLDAIQAMAKEKVEMYS